jgi:beta-lactamase regulating signal transducer with metallopeptidase domain
MPAWVLSGDNLITGWADSLIQALWHGSMVFGLVWAIQKIFPQIQPAFRCWLWRMVYLKFLISLVPLGTLCGVFYLPVPWISAIEILQSPVVRLFKAGPAVHWIPTSQSLSQFTATNLPVLLSPTVWFILWIFGIVWFAVRLVRERNYHRLTMKDCYPIHEPALTNLYLEFCAHLKIRKPPRILLSASVDSPSLQGIIRPRIVLPDTILSQYRLPEIKLMLAHELAHFSRRDLLWNWLPVVVRGLFFFHPLVWIAERNWKELHEICCDRLAVQFTKVRSLDYGNVLLKATVKAGFNLTKRPACMAATEFYAPPSKLILKKRLMALNRLHWMNPREMMAWFSVLILFGLAVVLPWQLSPSFFIAAYTDYYPVNQFSFYGNILHADGTYIKDFKVIIDGQKITGEYSMNSGGEHSANSFKGYLLVKNSFRQRRIHEMKVFIATTAGDFQAKYRVDLAGNSAWINQPH